MSFNVATRGFALSLVLLAACAPPFRAGFEEGIGAPPTAKLLMLFAGPSQETYLGCLSCSEHDAESVLNRHSEFGSKYGKRSIFNPYGDYGSRYSDQSACSRYASDPPAILDRHGTFYGRLTLNLSHPHAVKVDGIVAWLAAACGTG